MSTRSSWTGTICLDLLTIPVSLARATKDVREKSIVTLCTCHKLPIDQSQKCANTGKAPTDKIRGVKLGNGNYRAFSPQEWEKIENATKDDRLEILDVQPISQLPIPFGTATYYVRAEKDNRAAADGLAGLTLALAKLGMGAVVKLCKSAKQDLAIIHPYKGLMVMTLVPFVEGLNLPGNQERAHMKVDVNEKVVGRIGELLLEIQNSDGFDYDAYNDEGLRLRQEAVDRVLAGEKFEDKQERQDPVGDIMDTLMASLERRKGEVPV